MGFLEASVAGRHYVFEKSGIRVIRFIFIVAAALIVFSGCAWAKTDTPQIVILNSYHMGEEWADNQIAGILRALREPYPEISPEIENLDTKRYPGKEHLELERRFLAEKFRGRKADLVIALDNPAMELLIQARDEIFPGVPVVFGGINDFNPGMLKGMKDVTGVIEKQDYKGVIKLMLALHPKAKRIFVINDFTTTGQAVRREIERVAPEFKDRVSISYNAGGTMDELLGEIKKLPPDCPVLLLSYFTDSMDRIYSRAQSAEMISAISQGPVYGLHETRLGHGIVGGMLLTGQQHGEQVARIALRVLGGENPGKIPVEQSMSMPMFDFDKLQKFKIPQHLLPPESIIINKPPSFWEKYRTVLLPTLLIVCALALFVILLSGALLRLVLTDRALRESEAKHRDFIDSANSLIFQVDQHGDVTYINKHAIEFFGYSKEEIIGRNIVGTIVPEVDKEGVPIGEIVSKIAAQPDNYTNYQNENMLKDGTRVWIVWTNKSLLDKKGRAAGSLCIGNDITALKKAEDALRKSEANLTAVFENTSDRIWAIDPQYRLIVSNPAFSTAIKKASGIEVTPGLYMLYGGAPDELVEEWRGRYDRALRGESFSVEMESGLDGENSFMEYRLNPIWTGGRVSGAVITARDITGRKVSEMALESYRERLEEEVAQRTAELRATHEKLVASERLATLGQFAGGVAHEIRNPLAAIGSSAYLAKLSMRKGKPEMIAKCVEDIEEQIRVCAEVIDSIVRLSRSEKPELKPVELGEIVQSVINEKARAYEPRIETKIILPGHPVYVSADPAQLRIVFKNLANNALQAMGESGGALTAEVCAPDGASEGKFARVVISDTGCGVDGDALKKVFDPLFTTKARGIGFGLSIVKMIIERHGGEISMRSEPGRGAAVELTLQYLGREPDGGGAAAV